MSLAMMIVSDIVTLKERGKYQGCVIRGITQCEARTNCNNHLLGYLVPQLEEEMPLDL